MGTTRDIAHDVVHLIFEPAQEKKKTNLPAPVDVVVVVINPSEKRHVFILILRHSQS